ncbi:MAG: DUF1501 domain-containing protein, partial [Pirellulales bacterium]
MNFDRLLAEAIHRRAFLGHNLTSIGSLALASLLQPKLFAADAAGESAVTTDRWPGVIHTPHHPQRIKRVIHLYQAGGPSHLETLDHKPKLAEMNGKPMPESLT